MTEAMTLRETLAALLHYQQTPQSRFAFRSPCYFIRALDVATHIVFPELIENLLPRTARYLRVTSPRWGRSWREW